eukprot:CAMPEP_0197253242 /NCGR_PEP_ID=MMETSP1429-20130617/64282_1 /TAXON_ID=49237 /ORGANISM="Chaetoceros  sp., Strain UNC1202" /LENGTH=74 /DNA_ID=CAMNT_0042715847 /DNA_START=49 /DNA_END=270 /DNA_ORIENTATION=-
MPVPEYQSISAVVDEQDSNVMAATKGRKYEYDLSGVRKTPNEVEVDPRRTSVVSKITMGDTLHSVASPSFEGTN